ncbi:MAG: DUF47 family protein [Magnetococcales bacterium]|nr:DUF47 family protein [Magnetococcales bacterium]
MGGSNPVVGGLLDNIFPRVPPFFRYLHEQSELLVKTFSALVIYMEKGEHSRAEEIVSVEQQSEDMKERLLIILNNAFSTPMDREDVFRCITSIHSPIWSARIAVEEMESLGIGVDNFALEMATTLREAVISLQRGYEKLERNPATADGEAISASKVHLSIDKTYRRALASLYNIDHALAALQSDAPGAKEEAMKKVVDILKRRELYRHIHMCGRQVADAGTVLHGIVVQLS